ncbi:hypothetical protein L1987_30337 [Smallanthus sonchifolius]|uniref:Uncharacterized protein n=1 Tax=Smallanthus sonchifolius TaxID=185202 RepID=A0ACB9I2B8_9ASTR|nr:hypothetical protein L1987_30337 [Smallanthus sonchifolius]
MSDDWNAPPPSYSEEEDPSEHYVSESENEEATSDDARSHFPSPDSVLPRTTFEVGGLSEVPIPLVVLSDDEEQIMETDNENDLYEVAEQVDSLIEAGVAFDTRLNNVQQAIGGALEKIPQLFDYVTTAQEADQRRDRRIAEIQRMIWIVGVTVMALIVLLVSIIMYRLF